MDVRIGAAAATAVIFISPAIAQAQALLEKNVSVQMALTVAQTALTMCTSKASIAVVDRSGRLKVFIQGDGASPHNLELARRKAYTALTFRRTSLEWAKRTETVNQGQRSLADVIAQQGGVPIMIGEEIIGAVGLSGAPGFGEQEEECGKAGIAKIADQLR